MNDKLQRILQKIEAVVAREQDGSNVIDLARVKSNTRIVILHIAIEEVWQAFDAGLIEADPAEQLLRSLEDKLLFEVVDARCRPPSIAELRAAQPAAHRAARGVRKIRGAK